MKAIDPKKILVLGVVLILSLAAAVILKIQDMGIFIFLTSLGAILVLIGLWGLSVSTSIGKICAGFLLSLAVIIIVAAVHDNADTSSITVSGMTPFHFVSFLLITEGVSLIFRGIKELKQR